MGMSSHVIGIKPADRKWKSMKAAWDACEEAGVDAPEEVLKFFDHEDPDPTGVTVDIKSATKGWSIEGCDGFEVNLKKLPADVTVIRFFNSY